MNRHVHFLAGLLAVTLVLLPVEHLLAGGIPDEINPTPETDRLSDSKPSTNGKKEDAAKEPFSLLAGSAWQMVSFQSMDDAIGELRPKDPSVFTMHLHKDGTVSMRLDCNRAKGTWSADPAGEVSSGSFTFGPLAATRALCPPPHLDERIVKDAGFVRGFLLREGRLYLSLMADGGIYAWEPLVAKLPE